jgi:DNA-binding PadR family transcriptional regulator
VDDFDDEILAHYVEIGAITFEGIDENDEFIYKISEDAKDIAPDLWAAHTEYIDKTLIDLYSKGFLEVEYDENLEATFKISEEGIQIAKDSGIIDPDGFQ